MAEVACLILIVLVALGLVVLGGAVLAVVFMGVGARGPRR